MFRLHHGSNWKIVQALSLLLLKPFLSEGWTTIKTTATLYHRIIPTPSSSSSTRLFVEKNKNYDSGKKSSRREEKRKKRYGQYGKNDIRVINADNEKKFKKISAAYGTGDDSEENGNFIDNMLTEFANPYHSEIPADFRALVMFEEKKTKKAQNRQLRLSIYITGFISCLTLAFISIYLTEIREQLPDFDNSFLNDDVTNDQIKAALDVAKSVDAVTEAGFGWVHNNFLYEFFLLSNWGGYLVLATACACFLAASFEWDIERNNAEKIFKIMVKNQDKRLILQEVEKGPSLLDRFIPEFEEPKINKPGELYAKEVIVDKKKNNKKMKRMKEWNDVMKEEAKNDSSKIDDDEINEKEEKPITRRNAQFFDQFWNNDDMSKKAVLKKDTAPKEVNKEQSKKAKQMQEWNDIRKEEKVYNDGNKINSKIEDETIDDKETTITTTEPPKEIDLVLKQEKKKKSSTNTSINN